MPGAGTVAFHQDNPYQDWHTPGKVITAWIPLENTSKNGATLEYLVGSHKNGSTKRLNKFFTNKDYRFISKKLLTSSKKFNRHHIVAKKGSIVFHHGDTWHGSGFNNSKDHRRAIVAHCVPSNAKFHPTNTGGTAKIYKKYKKDESDKLEDIFFPLLWEK